MNNILCLFSGGRIAPKVEIGQKWMSDDDVRLMNNPFDNSRVRVYTVIDIKDGYLKYEINGCVFSDTINHFRFIRTLIK